MLFLIAFHFLGDETENTDFFDALNRMGANIRVFDGVYLLDAASTAYGVRKQLLPHLKTHDKLIVTQMYTNSSAGKLPKHVKKFIELYITSWAEPKPVIKLVPPPNPDILP